MTARRVSTGPSGYGVAVTPDSPAATTFDTAVLDIDGTLVDSVYAHVWSWREAFRTAGVDVPTWRVHRAIGMGGDRLVEAVADASVERSLGDEIRGRQSDLYSGLSRHLRPTRGAIGLLEALGSRGLKVVLASSGSRDDSDRAVALLGAGPHVDATVTGDDTDSTKPDDEPVRRAVDAVGGRHALVVGDAVWDVESARRAGHSAVGLLTGGIAGCELLAAGAAGVYDDPAALTERLEELLVTGVGPRTH
jgi:phosphoglycolate phosphatase-like HAD superfamily hydrolase